MKIGIFGLGLIGGSLGRALIKNTKHDVLGFDIDENAMLKAEMLNAINGRIDDDNIKTLDLVIIAMNPNATIKVLEDIVPKLKENAIVTDCCGNKTTIVKKMEELKKIYNLNFVGVHPMAGREFSGINHSLATLFEHAYMILVPVHTEMEELTILKQLFNDMGCAGIVVTNSQNHDEIIAYTSQLAHIVSSAYIRSPLAEKTIGFSAGSFRDMTRVAKINSDMWTELFFDNKENLLDILKHFSTNINQYIDVLEKNDKISMKKMLDEGNNIKIDVEKKRREKSK